MSNNADKLMPADPADVWDAYCNEVPERRRSPQGAMAFAIDRLRAARTEPAVAVEALWHPGNEIPPVASGRMREYILAIYRASTNKVHSFAATYLNAYPLEYQHGCPKEHCDGNGCDDGCPTTGWFEQTGDDNYSSMFNALELREGDYIKGWREVPQWSDATPVPEGWRMVPVEPTQAMLDAGYWPAVQRRGSKSVYRAMLDAAPAAPKSEVG